MTRLVWASDSSAWAGEPADPSDPLVVELLTIGPGDHPFFKFGHNALRIADARDGSDIVYNYGTFSFDSPTLLVDFFKGRLEYWLSKEPMAATVAHYAGEERSLLAQRLALSPTQKAELQRALEWNVLPEHRAYRYDYFLDNCSTRIRDILDRVTAGQLRRGMAAPATQSQRQHALRCTSDYWLEYLVLNVALGPMVDRRIERWHEAFLPEMLTRSAREVNLVTEGGATVPLVQSEQVLLAHDDPRPAAAPHWTARFFGIGALAGLGFFFVAQKGQRSRVTAVLCGGVLVLLGTVVGLLGTALLAVWAFTDHAVAFRNQNLLLLSPLALALPWCGISMARRSNRSYRRLLWISSLLVISTGMAVFLKALPMEQQDNSELLALLGPLWFGLAWAARRLARQQGERS